MRRSLRLSVLLTVAVAAIVGSVVAQRGLALGELRPVIARRYPAVNWVTVDTLARWLARPPAERPVLLDAREVEEFEVSHLPGAIRIDPDTPDLARVPPTDAEIVVYCSVGYRSAAVAQRLMEAGRRRVFNLEGGIFAWANSGRPVVARGRRVSRVHPYDEIWGRLLRPEFRAP